MTVSAIEVDAGAGVRLSGLISLPDGSPTALVLALHGAGMTGAYFHAPTDPRLSLLELGAREGYVVWAPDRPGYGASEGLPDGRLDLFGQSDILFGALSSLTRSHDTGAGCFVVAHSYGLKVALAMAADDRGQGLLGLDGSGTGLRYAFEPGEGLPPLVPGDRSPTWGPISLYPPSTFTRGVITAARVPTVQSSEAAAWPAVFAAMAPRITLPVRLSFGEHDRLWALTDDHFDSLRTALANVRHLEVRIQPDAGHNVSLGFTAEDYHRDALHFARECIDGRLAAW
jgi:pimeloyl-ACP methyl ester carboxylesterase